MGRKLRVVSEAPEDADIQIGFNAGDREAQGRVSIPGRQYLNPITAPPTSLNNYAIPQNSLFFKPRFFSGHLEVFAHTIE